MDKHSQEEAPAWRKSEGRRKEMEKIRKGDSQKSEDAGARKGRRVTKHCFSNVLSSRLAKAAGAEPAGQTKSCTPLWREEHLEGKTYKTNQGRATFGS